MNKTNVSRKLTVVLLLLVVALCFAFSACGTIEVTFDTNYAGGAKIKLTVIDGILTPPEVAREGYLFDDWYLDKECTKPLTYTHKTKNEDVYYANWIALPTSLSATYDGELFVGDTLTKEDLTVTVTYYDGSTKVLEAADFTVDLTSITNGEGLRSVRVTYTENSVEVYCMLTVEVVNPELKSISATYIGGKIFVGGTVSKSDFSVIGAYGNGTTQQITEFEIGSLDTQTAGKKSIVVTCGEFSTTVEVEVCEPQVVAISAEYTGSVFVGDALDESKLVVTLLFENGTQAATFDYVLGEFSSLVAGNKTVTITYGADRSVTSGFAVQVVQPLPVSLSAQYDGKVAVGGSLDETKFTVTVTYENGATSNVTEFSTSGFSSQTAGDVTVTVSCTVDGVNLSTQCVVQVAVAELTGITAEYYGGPVIVGGSLDISQITVTAFYDLLPSKVVGGFSTEGFSSNEVGEQQVKVVYTENGITKYDFITVYVVNRVLTGITAQPQTELLLLYGEKLNHSLVVVTAFYDDGSQKTVTEFSDNLDSSTAGEKTVTISYTESGVTKTDEITVTVYAPLKSVSALYTGGSLTVGDSLNVNDIEVTVTYADGTSRVVTNFSVGNFSSAVAGTQTVEITYTERNLVTSDYDTVSTTLEIVVVDSSVTVSADFSVHFMELGNANTGDSVYIKAGDTDILIDAGSRQNSAPTLSSYIDKYCTDGILEYVIVTHADQDHIAGFVGSNNQGIFDKYECKNIIQFARTNKNTQIYQNFCKKRDAEVEAGANLFTALECYNNQNGGQRVYDLTGDGSITMEILYQKFYEQSSSDENNYSVCVMFHQGENNYLFTGDLEAAGEASLVESNNLPEVVLFKGGHHGSYTSTTETLLAKIKPQYICVCCCAGSTEYTTNTARTFPAQDFIDRIAKYTDRVYVTTLGQIYNASTGTWVASGYTSLNGNIVFSCINGEISVVGSNNSTKLKDTEWFKANRNIPIYWQDGTSTPSLYHD